MEIFMDWIKSFVYGAQVMATEVPVPVDVPAALMPPAHVMSFDGGGMRGLYSLKLAQAIEDRLNGNLIDHVDMLAGSSTGSILSFGLASGKSLKNLELIYKNQGQNIFHETTWDDIKDGDGLFGPKYESTSLEQLLQANFSQYPLSSVVKPWVQAYSIDITSQTIKIFDTARAKDDPTEDVPIWYAVRSSTAAPTYFSPTEWNKHALCDGGLNVNNPSTAALMGIIDRFGVQSLAHTKLVSLGTGVYSTGLTYNSSKNMGALAWAVPISDMMIKTSVNIHDNWSKTMLQDRYVRVNGILTSNLPLDGYSPANILAIETAALTYIKENPDVIDKSAKLLMN